MRLYFPAAANTFSPLQKLFSVNMKREPCGTNHLQSLDFTLQRSHDGINVEEINALTVSVTVASFTFLPLGVMTAVLAAAATWTFGRRHFLTKDPEHTVSHWQPQFHITLLYFRR